jgi:hypothetical protein
MAIMKNTIVVRVAHAGAKPTTVGTGRGLRLLDPKNVDQTSTMNIAREYC